VACGGVRGNSEAIKPHALIPTAEAKWCFRNQQGERRGKPIALSKVTVGKLLRGENDRSKRGLLRFFGKDVSKAVQKMFKQWPAA
jgi:CTP:molybdopterin cytidylyltransferase MocA